MLDASSDVRRRHIGRYLRQRGETVGCQAAFTLVDGDVPTLAGTATRD